MLTYTNVAASAQLEYNFFKYKTFTRFSNISHAFILGRLLLKSMSLSFSHLLKRFLNLERLAMFYGLWRKSTCAIDAGWPYPGVIDSCAHNAVKNFCLLFPIVHLDITCGLPHLQLSHLCLLHPSKGKQAVWLKNRRPAISSARLVFISLKLIFMWSNLVWNCLWRVVTIRKRRGGWRGEEGVVGARVPPSRTVGREIHPKSLSNPPGLRGTTHWLVGLAVELCAVFGGWLTPGRSEQQWPGKEQPQTPLPPWLKPLQTTNFHQQSNFDTNKKTPRFGGIKSWRQGWAAKIFHPRPWLEMSPADIWMEKQTVDDKPSTEERPKYLDDNQKVCSTKSPPHKKFPQQKLQ